MSSTVIHDASMDIYYGDSREMETIPCQVKLQQPSGSDLYPFRMGLGVPDILVSHDDVPLHVGVGLFQERGRVMAGRASEHAPAHVGKLVLEVGQLFRRVEQPVIATVVLAQKSAGVLAAGVVNVLPTPEPLQVAGTQQRVVEVKQTQLDGHALPPRRSYSRCLTPSSR